MENQKKQKKKPRIRNRPRNKANLLKSQETNVQDNGCHDSAEEESLPTKQSSPEKSNATAECKPAVAQTITCIQQLIRKRLLKKEPVENEEKTKQSPPRNQTSEAKSKMAVNLLQMMEKQRDSKESTAPHMGNLSQEQQIFLNVLQKKAESVFTKGGDDLPEILLNNLQKLFHAEPLSEVMSSDDDDDEAEEYIEYIYKPRQYFVVSLCNFCKCDLLKLQLLPCSRCKLVYYCSREHEKNDKDHRQLCYGLKRVADSYEGHIFYKCSDFSHDQFRSYRIIVIRKAESEINRSLTATEQEILLFPRLCNSSTCREYRFQKLEDCKTCGQVFFCKEKPEHLSANHGKWCSAFRLFKEMVMFQHKFGRLEPSLPHKILNTLPTEASKTKDIFLKLDLDVKDECEYAALTQLSTAPLTAWYALRLTGQLKDLTTATIHLIGAEIEFEVDVLHKWELFFLHITPNLKELNVVFVGPELKSSNISLESLKKTKCCRTCRKAMRSVNYHFETQLYHDYCSSAGFLKPSLICFYNAGLYRLTGYQLEDTWPETILAASNLKCPIAVTSYTEYEAPLDLARIVQESNRYLSVLLPPIANPFGSEKPERNFISEEDAPLMFKNFYAFVIE